MENNEPEEAWTDVVRRHRKRDAERVIGTRDNTDSDLQAAAKTAWLYVGTLKDGTTEQNLVDFLANNDLMGIIECEALNARGRMKAFKIGVPYESLCQENRSEFWPSGILVRRFHLIRSNGTIEGAAVD